MAEQLIVIEYYNSHHRKFITFFRGDEDLAREFMTLHGRLHRVYRISMEEENGAPAQREAAAAV
jgi:hypothetical protein